MVGAAIAVVGVALARDALVAAYEMVKEIGHSIAASKLKPSSPTKKSEKPCTTAWVGEKDVQRGRRLTKSQEINQVRLGQSVMCDTYPESELVAIIAFGPDGYFPDIDKNQKRGFTYYKHFHPNLRNGSHIWVYHR